MPRRLCRRLIRIVDLTHRLLQSLPSNLIRQYPQMRSLDCSSNLISNFPIELIAFTYLHTLQLRWNKLTTLPTRIASLVSLTELDCSFNSLQGLPNELTTMKSLKKLILHDNQLISLPSEMNKMTALTVLNCNYNQLSHLPPSLHRCTNLTELSVLGNPLVTPNASCAYEGTQAILNALQKLDTISMELKSKKFASSSTKSPTNSTSAASAATSIKSTSLNRFESESSNSNLQLPNIRSATPSGFAVTRGPTASTTPISVLVVGNILGGTFSSPFTAPLLVNGHSQPSSSSVVSSNVKGHGPVVKSTSSSSSRLLSPTNSTNRSNSSTNPVQHLLNQSTRTKPLSVRSTTSAQAIAAASLGNPTSSLSASSVIISTLTSQIYPKSYHRKWLTERDEKELQSNRPPISPPSSVSSNPSRFAPSSAHFNQSADIQRVRQLMIARGNLVSLGQLEDALELLQQESPVPDELDESESTEEDVAANDLFYAEMAGRFPWLERSVDDVPLSPAATAYTKSFQPPPMVVPAFPSLTPELKSEIELMCSRSFLCSITCELMHNPVVASDGHTYEREAIERWSLKNNRSPLTNQQLPSKVLTPNLALRTMILEYVEEKLKAAATTPKSVTKDVPTPRLVGIELNPGPLDYPLIDSARVSSPNSDVDSKQHSVSSTGARELIELELTARTIFKDGLHHIFGYLSLSDWCASLCCCHYWYSTHLTQPCKHLTYHIRHDPTTYSLILPPPSCASHFTIIEDDRPSWTKANLNLDRTLFIQLIRHFPRIMQLKHIEISHIHLGEEDLDELVRLTRDHLVDVSITGVSATHRSLLRSWLPRLPLLHTVCVTGVDHFDEATCPFQCFQDLASLTDMTVILPYYSSDGAFTLFGWNHLPINLVRLNLRNGSLGAFEFLMSINHASLPLLTEFDLSHYSLNRGELNQLHAVAPNLTTLDPSRFDGDDFHDILLFKKLSTIGLRKPPNITLAHIHQPQTQVVDPFANEPSIQLADVLLSTLNRCTSLTCLRLHFWRNESSDGVWLSLSSVVPRLKRLELFNLRPYDSEGVREMVTQFIKLKQLILSGAMNEPTMNKYASIRLHMPELLYLSITSIISDIFFEYESNGPTRTNMDLDELSSTAAPFLCSHPTCRKCHQNRSLNVSTHSHTQPQQSITSESIITHAPSHTRLVGIELNPGPVDLIRAGVETHVTAESMMPTNSSNTKATNLFNDGLLLIYSYLTLEEFVSAIQISHHWNEVILPLLRIQQVENNSPRPLLLQYTYYVDVGTKIGYEQFLGFLNSPIRLLVTSITTKPTSGLRKLYYPPRLIDLHRITHATPNLKRLQLDISRAHPRQPYSPVEFSAEAELIFPSHLTSLDITLWNYKGPNRVNYPDWSIIQHVLTSISKVKYLQSLNWDIHGYPERDWSLPGPDPRMSLDLSGLLHLSHLTELSGWWHEEVDTYGYDIFVQLPLKIWRPSQHMDGGTKFDWSMFHPQTPLMKNIQEWYIPNTAFGPEDYSFLARSAPALTKLFLEPGIEREKDGLRLLAKSNLLHLMFERHEDYMVDPVPEIIHLTQLTSLTLEHCYNMDAESWQLLFTSLINLEMIELIKCDLNVVSELLVYLPRMVIFKEILVFPHITFEKFLARLTSTPLVRLQELTLISLFRNEQCNNLKEALQMLCSSLETSLRYVNVQHIGIRNEGFIIDSPKKVIQHDQPSTASNSTHISPSNASLLTTLPLVPAPRLVGIELNPGPSLTDSTVTSSKSDPDSNQQSVSSAVARQLVDISAKDSLHTIGPDAICVITQFLSRNELRSFTQLNRLCAQILYQRHQAYYQLPLPSFQRSEFNLNTYRKWLMNRQFLVITSPEQLLSYSQSRIMIHATDIELQLDEYCMNPTTPPPSTQTLTPSSALDRLRTFAAKFDRVQADYSLESAFVKICAAIKRFHYIRSLRLVFRPSKLDHTRLQLRCHCSPLVSFKDWFLKIAEICLRTWGPRLISFEWEISDWYRCTLLTRNDFLFTKLPLLTSLQHLGIFFPNNVFKIRKIIPDLLESFQFHSADSSVLILSGGCPIDTKQSVPQPPPLATNAAHCIWLPSLELQNVYQYLNDTNQLVTDATTGAFELGKQKINTLQPIVSIQRQQLRHLRLDPRTWSTQPIHDRFALMNYHLALMVANFTSASHSTRCIDPASYRTDTIHGSLESLIIYDLWVKFPYYWRCKIDTAPILYPLYLDQLSTSLRMLTFYSNIEFVGAGIIQRTSDTNQPEAASTGVIPSVVCDGCGERRIPVGQRWHCTVCHNFDYCQECKDANKIVKSHTLSHEMFQTNEPYTHLPVVPPLPFSIELQWPRLECFTLRNRLWESTLQPREGPYPPLPRETWIAFDRTLPKLESLGLSMGFIPIHTESFAGILLRIKHLHLYDTNIVYVPDLDRSLYRHYLVSRLTSILIHLPQLESLQICLIDNETDKDDELWISAPWIDCLLPCTLSSNSLRSVAINAPNFKFQHATLEQFELFYQMHLLQLYAIWKLFQPSFEPPLAYTSIRTFLYPLIEPSAHHLYDMKFVRLDRMYQQNSPASQSQSQSSVAVNGPSETTLKSGWKSRFTNWMKKEDQDQEHKQQPLQQQTKRLELIETRTHLFDQIHGSLQVRMIQLFQAHPSLTFQPRPFTLTLETDVVPTNSAQLWR